MISKLLSCVKINMGNQLFYVLFLMLIVNDVDCSGDVLGCGGFIKSDIPIDFSSVILKLYSKSGTLKYQTDCAPNNGYYLIPLYDKGDYVIQVEPPLGWQFEPTRVPVHIDGTSDPCTLGKDINFYFKGFSIMGKVLSQGSVEGPAGVTVKLTPKDQDKVLAETQSVDNGEFAFAGIFPGSYVVAAYHPQWKFLVQRSAIEVEKDSTRVQNSLVVAGYDVRGRVTSEGEAIQNVHFLLFSSQADKPKLEGCLTSPVEGFADSKGRVPVCHVVSGSDGVFVFSSIPPGLYSVVPFYKGENIKFDVTPNEVNFTVAHSSFVFLQVFKVEGFSVGGWVKAAANGRGIALARILLNGEQTAETNTEGRFHLENMKPGNYKLHVVKDGVNFDILDVKITPNTPRIPEIIAKSFRVCGQLNVVHLPAGMDVNARRLIKINNKDGKALSFATRTDEDGHFCVDVAAGSYQVLPVVDDNESAVGLKFQPLERSISVEDKPLDDVSFQQMFASLKGRVKCQTSCSEIQALLKPLDSIHHELASHAVVMRDSFSFNSLLPGEYSVSILKESWCWKEKSVHVKIVNSENNAVEFVHSGYKLTIVSSHDTNVNYKLNDKVTGSLKVNKGSNELCVPKEGTYEITPKGCHLFVKDKLKFSTSSPSVVTLTASHHLVTGTVKSSVNITDLAVKVLTEGGETPSSGDALVAVSKSAAPGEPFLYEVSYSSPRGQKLTFVPSGSALLFYPPTMSVTVQDDCMPNAVQFEAKQGMFLSGKIVPPLADVKIVVTPSGEDASPIAVTTSADGRYRAGPLHANQSYSITAHKEGYLLTKLSNKNDFNSFKLAEVHVLVADAAGKPLAGVLLSLSGGSDYRQNSLTQADGTIKFVGLHPGQYFLRPMLKEFSFDPSSTMVDVTEGINKQLMLKGKRVAFSCFGKVTSLTGDPEKAVVEVVGTHECSKFQEEAMTEQDGKFRIRGLIPKCRYILRMKSGLDVNQHIERATPSTLDISVQDGDITGLHLITFRHFNQVDISGNVITHPDYLPTLKVLLSRDDNTDQMMHTLSLSASSFFHFPAIALDERSYTVKLETTLSPTSYTYTLPQVNFKSNLTFRHITLQFAPTARLMEHDVHQSSPLAIPLALAAVVLVCCYHRLLPLFNQASGLVQSFTFPARNFESANSDNNTERKRRPKLRKVQ